MSMDIDFTTPLTKDERSYLDSRGRYAEIERSDSLNGVETPKFDAGDGTGLQQVDLTTSEQRATEKARLLARLREIDPEAADAAEESSSSDEAEDVPYEVMTVPALDAELKVRQLSVSGTKAEKIKRLEDDDELAALNQE